MGPAGEKKWFGLFFFAGRRGLHEEVETTCCKGDADGGLEEVVRVVFEIENNPKKGMTGVMTAFGCVPVKVDPLLEGEQWKLKYEKNKRSISN